jgi:hypothetical protein
VTGEERAVTTAGQVPQCPVLPAGLVVAYARNGLPAAQAWSAEAHLPACAACREVLAGCGDAGRLERSRAVVLAAAGQPEPGLAARALRRCGVPDHVAVLLAATPSLRRSWLAGVVLVLAVVAGSSQLAASAAFTGGPRQHSWVILTPFLIITPLLPLAAVAAAFSSRLDPAWRLTSAAPVSQLWLLCVRSAAVVAATLVPVTLAALTLPGAHWLAVALLLPALAICAAALALATVIRAEAAVAAAAAGWTAVVVIAAATAARPASFLGPAGQLMALTVLAGAAALIAARRNKIDYGWTE